MRLTLRAHACIRDHIKSPQYSLDATCGSGYDTMFLQSITQTKVWSFDVQDEALTHAKAQAQNQGQTLTCQTQWVHDGHQHMDAHVDRPLDVVMFNFGYWPKGDHQVTTSAKQSMVAVQKALNMLSPMGIMTLLLYPGHAAGKVEAEQIQSWVQTLSLDRWTRHVFLSQPSTPETPILWIIKSGVLIG